MVLFHLPLWAAQGWRAANFVLATVLGVYWIGNAVDALRHDRRIPRYSLYGQLALLAFTVRAVVVAVDRWGSAAIRWDGAPLFTLALALALANAVALRSDSRQGPAG